MSSGFFGSYFRRKQEEDAPSDLSAASGAGSAPDSRPASEHGPARDSSAPDGDGPGARTVAPAEVVGSQDERDEPGQVQAERALSQRVLGDEVLAAFLEKGLVEMPRALAAARAWDDAAGPIWRCVLPQDAGLRDRMLTQAAATLGFESAVVNAVTPGEAVLNLVRGFFPAAVWTAFERLHLLPCAFSMDPATMQPKLVLATPDPAHPKIQDLIAALKLRVELRHAPAAAVLRRLGLDGGGASSTAPAQERDAAATASHAPEGETLARYLQHRQAAPDVAVDERVDPVAPEAHAGDGAAGALPESALGTGADEHPPTADTADEAPDDAAADPDIPNLEAVKSRDRVVAMLLRKEVVTPSQVREAQLRQERQEGKETLWRALTTVPNVNREAVYAEAARVYAFPIARLGEVKPDPEFARSVMETFSEQHRDDLIRLRVLPFECDLEHQTGAIKLVFVTHDPTRPELHRLMQRLKLERFELRYASEAHVSAALAEAFPRKNEFLERMQDGDLAFDLGTSYDESRGLIDEDALEAEISRSTLINLFEATLVESVRQGASDIHIYPNPQKQIEIHFRVDGRLSLWHTEKKVHPEALLAVIKDNATNVDRFERDAAQDGFIQRWIDDALIRFRVSVLPIANASQEIRSESIVIRVLDDRKVLTDLRQLGLLDSALDRFANAIRQPHGMVILTGPTGSGKSTTLVAALHQTVTPEVNVLTVEDPVEYIIPGVRQIKLNHKLGLEGALRSILRHDPDVVMVGEMRDRETAELAIKLANTGHLTFSTLHTNDAPAAISRLYKMGIEPFLIAYAINLVVAQRLIRKLCPACKIVDDDPDPVMLTRLGFSDAEIAATTIYQKGHDPKCPTCKGVGYKGRRAVAEALHFSRAIRHMIVEADRMIDEERIRKQAVTEGMLTLQDSAREIVKQGETDIREMIRVVMTEH